MHKLVKNQIDNEIIEEIKKTIYSYIDPQKYEIFLFWSRAKWDFKINSDYDIGIIWKQKVPFNTINAIKTEMEDIPAIIDIVDFNNVNSDFKKIALSNVLKF
ncbi:MAG: hypothetical protein ACD_49C00042G0008 [uncultured bacterium (gcode 4)]|uniref:Polymerase beta nucleotidyltransferase domain-containing protein n=1 Tax=uncultured bacterium (gcode 4) TaxID=1234023 RepID=K2AEF3_9BACT|nr:MAG: hypothetical protein ACD_49C00042G0008 [uncultured bacterium (gcode 4)]